MKFLAVGCVVISSEPINEFKTQTRYNNSKLLKRAERKVGMEQSNEWEEFRIRGELKDTAERRRVLQNLIAIVLDKMDIRKGEV